MRQFDTLFSQIRSLLHREDVNIGQHLKTHLDEAHTINAARCVDVLCPYVNSHLQQRDITPVDVFLDYLNDRLKAPLWAKHVPALFRVDIYSDEGALTPNILTELAPISIEYYTTELIQSRVIAPDHIRLTPNIKSLYLFITCEQFLAHLQHPLHGLEEICFYNPLTEDEARSLNQAPQLAQLRLLTFCDFEQTDDILPDLNIQWERMIDFGFEVGQADEGLAHLMAHDRFEHLLYLSLSGASLGPRAQLALRNTNLSRVQTLWLSNCALKNDLSSQLLSQTHSPLLHRAILASNDLDDDFAKALGGITTSPYLIELDLADNALTQVGLAHLSQWPGLHTVQKLRLTNNQIAPEAFAILAQSPHTTNLTHLTVDAIDPDLRPLFQQNHPNLIIEDRT